VIVILERDIAFPQGPLGLAWRLAWVLGVSVVLGAATYAWVERPTIAWSRRYTGRRVLGRTPDATSRTAIQPRTATPTTNRSASPDA
jgi:peptidoglycan/LPS O-acetylase OafA/YrhL